MWLLVYDTENRGLNGGSLIIFICLEYTFFQFQDSFESRLDTYKRWTVIHMLFCVKELGNEK